MPHRLRVDATDPTGKHVSRTTVVVCDIHVGSLSQRVTCQHSLLLLLEHLQILRDLRINWEFRMSQVREQQWLFAFRVSTTNVKCILAMDEWE